MPDDVKCVPGQEAPALPGGTVELIRGGGFGRAEGAVTLIGSGDQAPMMPWQWTDAAIVATIPKKAPGTAPFRVEVSNGSDVYTGPIDIRSLPGDDSGYPPAHK